MVYLWNFWIKRKVFLGPEIHPATPLAKVALFPEQRVEASFRQVECTEEARGAFEIRANLSSLGGTAFAVGPARQCQVLCFIRVL